MARSGEAATDLLRLMMPSRTWSGHWRSEGANRSMTMRKSTALTVLLTGFAAAAVAGSVASAQDSSAQATYRDIEQTLGSVPTFFKMFPESGIPGAWAEFKAVQLNPKTALNGKTKELIGLAVAAQIPCHYCIYFHTAAAKLNGATDAEIREAVAMAAISRHWSTVLNGMQIDLDGFKRETDTVLRLAGEKAKATSKSQ
jgi:AhpD family alkylhydroperoxidase